MPALSLLKKKWVYLNNHEVAKVHSLQTEHPELHPVLLQILLNRGIDSAKKIKEFLHPALDNLSALDNIQNIQPAARFILEAIASGKKITIYGDYDVDGVTGTALLVCVMRELGAANLDFYVPHRFTEGYGLNKEAIRSLQAAGSEVLITVDCGISNYEEIKYAKELGLSVVVTDHHMPPVVLPEADFLINPKINNSAFAARNISGVGVAFKLAEQLFNLKGYPNYAKTKKYLDLVVLGTIADIVPLLEENRILTVFGLKQINKMSRTGIRALVEVAGLKDAELQVKDISFGLAPRINAAGRMDNSVLAVNLLLEENYSIAKRIAEQLNQLNNQRQETGQLIKEKVIAEIEKLPNRENEKVFILSSSGWHPGIIGIVASQIVKIYNRPTALIAVTDSAGRGSIRSLDELDIFEPLNKCAYLLKDFGGHTEAAGFEIEPGRIEEFKDKFTRIIEESIGFDNLVPALKIDLELNKRDITKKLAEELEQLAPFGQNNPVPVFSTKELSIYDFSRIGDGRHLRLSLTDGENIIDAVGFGLGNLYDELLHLENVEIAFNLSINKWQGRQKLQLVIKDLRKI